MNLASCIEYLKDHIEEVLLIISDFHMANGNGHTLASYLHKIEKGKVPKLFFLSGYTSIDIEEKGWNMGHELVRKPIRTKDLLQKVQEYLNDEERKIKV